MNGLTETVERLETVELPAGTPIHYSAMDGKPTFACGIERFKGDWWSHWRPHVTCDKCLAWIKEPA